MVVDTLSTAADLIERARAANSLGRPATAERLLQRAVRALSRPGATVADLQLRGTATRIAGLVTSSVASRLSTSMVSFLSPLRSRSKRAKPPFGTAGIHDVMSRVRLSVRN